MSTTHQPATNDNARQGTFSSQEEPEHDIHKLAELISDIRVAMLTTFPPGGKPHARPMYTQALDAKTFDGTLWFMSATVRRPLNQRRGEPSFSAVHISGPYGVTCIPRSRT